MADNLLGRGRGGCNDIDDSLLFFFLLLVVLFCNGNILGGFGRRC